MWSQRRNAAVGDVGVLVDEAKTVARDTSRVVVEIVDSKCAAVHLCTSLTQPDQAGQVLSTPPSQLALGTKLSFSPLTDTEP